MRETIIKVLNNVLTVLVSSLFILTAIAVAISVFPIFVFMVVASIFIFTIAFIIKKLEKGDDNEKFKYEIKFGRYDL